MKKLIKNIGEASNSIDKSVFTLIDIVNILSDIDELKDHRIGIKEHSDGTLLLYVGDTDYVISGEQEDRI